MELLQGSISPLPELLFFVMINSWEADFFFRMPLYLSFVPEPKREKGCSAEGCHLFFCVFNFFKIFCYSGSCQRVVIVRYDFLSTELIFGFETVGNLGGILSEDDESSERLGTPRSFCLVVMYCVSCYRGRL